MTWQTILSGIGAIITGAGGCWLVITEFRRRDRQALKTESAELSADLTVLRHDLVVCRRYAFELAETLAEHGVEPPEPPSSHSEVGL